MKTKLLTAGVFLSLAGFVCAQEEQWEPHKQLKGYISAQAEYIDGLDLFERSYGVSLSEAGLLFTYQPLRKMTIKTTFVYRPGIRFDHMLVDAYAEWNVKDMFKIKGGRFLSPLSPLNLAQFAPMNTAASLPMLVTHHNMYPMNMDGVSFSGFAGNDIRVSYTVFGGGYFDTGYLPYDPVGYAGREILYTEAVEVDGELNLDNDIFQRNELFGGIGAHAGVSFSDIFTVGINSFYGGAEAYVNPYDPDAVEEASHIEIGSGTKHAYGFDARFQLSKLELTGEHWFGKFSSIGEPSKDISGGFYEMNLNFGKITPYFQKDI